METVRVRFPTLTTLGEYPGGAYRVATASPWYLPVLQTSAALPLAVRAPVLPNALILLPRLLNRPTFPRIIRIGCVQVTPVRTLMVPGT